MSYEEAQLILIFAFGLFMGGLISTISFAFFLINRERPLEAENKLLEQKLWFARSQICKWLDLNFYFHRNPESKNKFTPACMTEKLNNAFFKLRERALK